MSRAGTASARRATTRGPWLEVAAFALLAYVPFLLSSPGKVAGDTKQYLFLDPSRFLARVPYLWDSHVGLGNVPTQHLGYLFPMGPYFWLMDAIGAPDWVAQRVWLGTISLGAALGARWLLHKLGIGRTGAFVGALVYMLTPYQLAFTARLSVLLLPWAGLPWLIGLAMRSTRVGGWRDPAWFALVVLTVGTINLSTLELALLGPLMWFAFELVRGRDSARRAIAAGLRVAVLTLGVSTWWLIALRTQALYGLPLLDLTETVEVVAFSSTPLDLVRGLGNWFFYGRDSLGVTLEQAPAYGNEAIVQVATYAIPVLALVAAAAVRWRHRAYFVALVVVGTIVGVGAWPFDDPSPLGALFRFLAENASIVNSLRNTPRVVPLVALGLAALLAAGVDVLAPRAPRISGTVVIAGILALAFLPVWRVGYLSESIERPEDVPGYWEAAAVAIDARSDATRVLEIPGANFTAYRWGNTIEPVTPGITDRPFVAREVLPLGTPGSVDLLDALDHRMQEETFEPAALVPLARLMGVGTISLRSDLETERFDLVKPGPLWRLLTEPIAPGLERPQGFGEPRTDGGPPPVALFTVEDALPIVRTAPREQPVLLSGDGDGIVEAAAAGLVDGRQLVLETAALSDAQLLGALDAGADVVLTDSNRRRSQTWFDRIKDAVGATERAGTEYDDFRLETFPETGDDARTVVEHVGGTVDATKSLRPADRATRAFDADADTAWLVDSAAAPGARITITLDAPAPAARVTLVQHDPGVGRQVVSDVELRVDGGEPLTVSLGPESLTAAGQVVELPVREVRELAVTITDVGGASDERNPVGFSEIALDGTTVSEVVRLPVDLERRVGDRLAGHRLDVVLARERSRTAPDAGETRLARRVVIPDAREFGLTGTARIAGDAPDDVLDAALGTTAPGAVYRSSGHLPLDAATRASRAFDADAATAWTSPPGERGAWVEAEFAQRSAFDQVEVTYVDDANHAIPAQVHLEADGVPVRTMALPTTAVGGADGRRTVVIPFDAFSARRVRLVVDSVRAPSGRSAAAEALDGLPVSLAEVGLAGAPVPAAPGGLASGCRDDLVAVDGVAVPVTVAGDPADAQGLALTACSGSVALDAGGATVVTAEGARTGFDVDRLVLSSDRDGDAAPVEVLGAPRSTAGADVRVEGEGRVSYDLEVTTDGEPFWLVLGQSQSDGWEATVDGRSLGPSTMVDGYANGWLVRPGESGTLGVHLRWTPQRVVWFGLAVSIVAVLACIVLVVRAARRGRAPGDDPMASCADRPSRHDVAAYDGRAPSVGAAALLAAGAAVGAAPVSRWWVGLIVGAATFVAATVSRGRIVLSAGAPFAVAFGALTDTPELAWVAVTLLAADAIVGWWFARGAGAVDRP